MKKNIKLGSQFNKNIADHSDFILCTQEELAGLSTRVIDSLSKDKVTGKYIVTLQAPHYGPFMSFAINRQKREELAKKSLQKGGQKNLKLIKELAAIRHEMAFLLGYKHHADFRTANRMAKSGEVAMKFQTILLKKLEPKIKKESKVLQEFAKRQGVQAIKHYDLTFFANLLKKEMYAINPEEVREYFPLEHVQDTMFKLFGKLYGIVLKEISMPLWHTDARIYEICNTKEKDLVGYIALDLYARQEKSSHIACLFDLIPAYVLSYKGNERQASVGVILCNFPVPKKKASSLLGMWEVETLFHEFGHGLHHAFSQAQHRSHAGTSVAWDFVETPSQFHENWVWNDTMLQKLSKHYVTGKKMPVDMCTKILKSKLFRSATINGSTLVLGILDMELHMGLLKDPTKRFIELEKKYFGIILPKKETLFPAGFGHIGQFYDAAYYSYLWALVYAQDAISLFEEKGIFNEELGMKWRKEVLEKGSSEDEMKLMRNFLGRAPSKKAFLKEVIGQ